MKEKDIEKERENRVSLSRRGIMHPANATESFHVQVPISFPFLSRVLSEHTRRAN